MLKPEQIPPDAMYAAWKAMNAGMTLNDAIAAALNAWPGMFGTELEDYTGVYRKIILPLPQEPSDERE